MFTPLILLVVTAYLLYCVVRLNRTKNFPPGPTNYPIIGAAIFVAGLADVTTLAFLKLEKLFGPITGLYFSKNRFIVINGYEATKEFYALDEFAYRPYMFIIGGYRWGGRMLGVFFSNGRLWAEQRRFTLRHLRDFGFGKRSMEGLIHEEAEACIDSIKKAVVQAGSSSVISIHDKFGVSVINILWAIMGGARYSHEDAQFKKLLQAIQEMFKAGNPTGNFVNSYPWLRHFPYFKQQFKALVSGQEKLHEMIGKTIEEHLHTRQCGTPPRDLMDTYLDAMKESERDPNSTFSKDQLSQILMDLFAAGSESTSNSIAFAVLHMLRNPGCQEKVHRELDQVVGRDRLPSYEDKQKLPFTFAVITESFRMSPVAPLSVVHYNLEDVKFMGYDIPKKTWALVNFTSTNMDKTYWGDPEVFRPERFLDDNGKFSTSKLDHVMGFGAGKRQCLGEPLARMSNYLLFVAVMQRFHFEMAPGTSPPTLKPIDGFTVSPMPFSAKVTRRF